MQRKTYVDELIRQAPGSASALRKDERGKKVVAVKEWDLSDGEFFCSLCPVCLGFVVLSFVFVCCVVFVVLLLPVRCSVAFSCVRSRFFVGVCVCVNLFHDLRGFFRVAFMRTFGVSVDFSCSLRLC